MIPSANTYRSQTSKVIQKPLPLWAIMLAMLALCSLIARDSEAQNPFIPKYDAVKRSERCFTVTWESNNQFGAVWWADKVDFSQDTSFNFVVYMGDRDGNGADGLAFVMHQDPRDTITDPSEQVIIDTDGRRRTWDIGAATGDDGGGLGFAMHTSRVDDNQIPGPHAYYRENHKIQPSVAVEIDTWNNRDVPDGRNGTDANGVNQAASPYYGWDHTAVIYNGDIYGGQQVIEDANGNSGRILPLKPGYAYGTGNNPDGSVYHNIEDDRCYMFQINWEVNRDGTQTMQLWADVYNGTTNLDGLQLIMTHTDDMLGTVFGGNPIMRFGFTGSTGGSINEQTICLLGENLKPFAQDDYASIPMNTTTVIDVEANDNDPDGDQLHVPIIMDPARFGQATIFDSVGVNYMRYTPNTGYVGRDTIGYVTCDVNSTKCYAKCDTAFVYIDVGCIPFDVDVAAQSPNLVCTDSVPANGIASANVDATFLRGTVWYEGFEDAQAQTTEDTGPSAWTTRKEGSDCSPGNNLYAQNFEFRTKVVTNTDCELVFETGEIDISGVSDVSISIDFKTSNAEYESDDYIESFYILDGGPETMFDVNGRLDGTFGTRTSSTDGINGSTLKVVVRTKSDHSSEEYSWDNIHVTGIGTGVPDVSYYWYEGATQTGPVIYEGAVNNTLRDGTYTVVAIDNLTGCPSNPETITIDSAGYRVPGGFIEQLSPFTNCSLPYDGSLGAGVIDGSDTLTTGYSFEWFYQEDPKIPSFIQRTGAIANNLESREYTVLITENSTGCDTTINAEVPNAVSIPTVTVNKIADVLSCTDPNSGIAEANVGGVTNGYRFEWYAGPSIGSGPPNFTGSTVNTLAVGAYTVQAIDSITSCPSDPANVIINDLTTTPDLLVTVDSEQISCDPTTPTGQLTGAVDDGGTPTTAGYTFNWYYGPNDIIPARSGYTGGPTADGLEAGTYRLVVVEDATNCTSSIDTLIQDLTITPPDIALNATDVTSCAAPNGTITVTLDPALSPADYEFEVYRGFGVIADSLVLTTPNSLIENRDVGNYTVLAVDIVTACPTNPATITINDATVYPNASFISQPQVSCNPNNFTGSLTANMGFGAISDYTYEWYDNSGTSISPSSANGEVISNLDAGSYEVRIIDDITQCASTYYPVVNVAQEFPIDSVSATASTYCAPGNGELRGYVLNGAAADHTFIWEDASGNPIGSTATISGLAPGDYTLQIQNNNTECLSGIAPVTVYDSTLTPIPTLVPTDNSSCDVNNPNGQIEVTATNESPTYNLTDYIYTWSDNSGNATGTPAGANGEILTSLSAGTYRVEVLNTTTGCSNAALSVVNDINIKPVIDEVRTIDAAWCIEPYQSQAWIPTVNGGQPVPGGFTFEWTNLDNMTVIPSSNDTIVDDVVDALALPPGNYQVVALNEFNCPSDPITFEIKDNSTDPLFTVVSTPNSSCSWVPSTQTGTSNGTLSVNYTGSGAIINYSWERESPEGSSNWVSFGGNTSTENGLHELDNYRVTITDDRGCTSTNFASIAKITDPNPYIGWLSVNDLTDCANPNGDLEAQVLVGNPPPAGYGYEFQLSGTQTATQMDNGFFDNLQAGAYEVTVINTFTECISNTIDTTINILTDLDFTVTPVAPANCTGAQGSIAISGRSNSGLNEPPATGPGFDFDWFVGIDKSTNVNASDLSTPDQWSSQAINLVSNNYTIQITDRSTSCSVDTTVFLPSNSVPVFLDPNITHSTQCTPGNGSVELNIDPTTFGILPSLATANYSDYEYILFEGTAIDANWNASGTTEYRHIPDGTIPAGGPVIFTDLEPGQYIAVAKEAFGDNCFSEPRTFEIELRYDFDPLSLVEVTPDNTCSTPTGNGQLSETNNAFYTIGAEFEYTWYKGTDTSLPANIVEGPTNVTKFTPDTLRAGQYTLFVEIVGPGPVDGLGCTTSGVVDLNKQLDDIRIVDAPTVPNTICISPGNGELHISDISVNSVPQGNTIGFDSFTLYNESLMDITASKPGSGTSADAWENLDPKTFFVTATNIVTQCITPPFRVEIDDISEDPVITTNILSPDYSCISGTGTGALEAFANGVQSTAEYTFTWHLGTSAGPNVSDPSDPFMADNLVASPTQAYIIEVEDALGTNLGCRSEKLVTLFHQATSVVVNTANPTPQDICSPNGEIQVIEIAEYDPFTGNTTTITQPAVFTGSYLAKLYNDDLSENNLSYSSFEDATGYFGVEDIAAGTFDYDVIPAGNYYVRAQNTVTGCEFGPPTQVVVRDISRNPIISASLISPDFACFDPDPGNVNHTGQLLALAEGGSDGDDVAANFSPTWTLTSSGNAVPTSGNYNAVNLWPDTYTLTVVDTDGRDNGCVSSREFQVPVGRRNIEVFASSNNQTTCDPNAVIQIDSVTVEGVNVVDPHSSFSGILRDTNQQMLARVESGFDSDADPFINLIAGQYYAQVQDQSTLCYSNLDLEVVFDASTDPVIDAQIDNPQWSLNPNPLSWTGAMSATVNEVNGIAGTYDVNWYHGIGSTDPMNQSALSLDSLDRGLYTITAENASTGCVSSYYIYLPYEYLEPTFNTLLTPKTVCAPNNGAIEVTDMALEGDPDDLNDYDFDFFVHDYAQGDTPDATIPGDNSGTVYGNINTGSYYIVATENWWWVKSAPVQVEVADSTTNPIITFDATNYHPVTSCDQSAYTDGALGIEVYEDMDNPYLNAPFIYSYTWIDESTGQVISGESSNTITGLHSGEFTVVVVNLDNNCEAERTFVIDDDSTTPIVAATQSPNTNCVIEIANGITDANVINSNNTYNYQWFAGSGVKSTPDFEGQTWRGRPSGDYTVIAVDQELYTCVSEPVVIQVKDATERPVVLINEISPVTNCDPERPNGVLSAVTQDGVTGHTFNWYFNDELYSSGPIASDLGLFDYDLVVINDVTLCETSMTAGPTALLGVVPPPDVDILSDRTSCLNPDGQATATIEGNVVDYIFRYYNKFTGDELSNLYQDYVIHDLDTSTYLVTAEERQTGCVSEPTEFAIANATYFPEISVIATPSSCMDPTGQAEIIISDMTRDFKVNWIGDNGFNAQEKELVFIPVGKYQVIVEGTDGCTTEAEAEIKGDIIIYNAVSANQDGLNEFFQIVCMEYFLDNNVKIFNRAGLLVYEQNYYDPTDPSRRFEGISNKGASVAGTELPIGTYFYVADKNDGSKPKVGYLELNR